MADKQYSIVLSARAERELTASFDWYEGQQHDLGSRFISIVLEWLDKIKQHPETYSIKHKRYREAKIDHFPYVIIYRINKKQGTVRVVSVFHTAQSVRIKY